MKCSRREFLGLCASACLASASPFALGACSSSPGGTPAGRPVVYSSFYPIFDITREIAGDTLDLHAFMPPNKDPHLWEPTPKSLRHLAASQLLIVNGANMERWVDQVRDNLPNLDILTLSDDIDLITYKGAAAMGEFQYMARLEVKAGTYGFEFGHTHEDIMRVAFIERGPQTSEADLVRHGREVMNQQGEVIAQHRTFTVRADQVYALEMGHESGYIGFTLPRDGDWILLSDRASESLLSYRLVTSEDGDEIAVTPLLEGSSSGHDKVTFDPHSWLSLVNAKRYCSSIQNRLCELSPDDARVYKKNKLDIVSRMTDLSAEYDEKFARVERREFVVTHNAYSYLCRDFNIKHFPLQGLTSTEAPALKTVRKAIDFCKSHGVTTVFYELGMSSKGADTVASEIGGKAVPLASMEYVSEEQGAEIGGYVEIMRSNIEAIYQSLT